MALGGTLTVDQVTGAQVSSRPLVAGGGPFTPTVVVTPGGTTVTIDGAGILVER